MLTNATQDTAAEWLSGTTPPVFSRPWDSSDPLFSAYSRDLIKTVFKCYVRQIIIFLGIPGNAVSCAVFCKQGLSDRVNLLLFWLAVADFFNMLIQLTFVPSCYMSDRVTIINWSTILNTKVTHFGTWFTFTSGTLIVVMSVDRCLSVVMPLKARRLLSYRPMVAAIVVSYLAPLCWLTSIFLSTTVMWRVDPATNRSRAYVVDTPWFPMDSRLSSQVSYDLSLIAKPIFLAVVTVSCVITISHLRRASRQRAQMTMGSFGKPGEKGGDGGDERITKMLLLLCVVYAVVLLLEITSGVAHTLDPEYYLYRKYHNTYVVIHQMLVFPAYCVNSTVNFFAYLLLSSRFRSTLKALFCSFRRT